MKKVALLLALIFIGLQVFSQTREITGTVTSAEDGGAIPGVSVLVKGTTLGTVTDLEGRFRLQVPNNAQTLVFSFVGMTSQEVAIGNQNTFRIQLKAETIGVDEVVVTALGISREKKSLGYAVQEVKSEELVQAGAPNVISTLSGKVAGMQVNQSGGQIGSSARIVLRGNSSFGDNQPLIVVDGIPIANNSINQNYVDYGTGLNDINPQDIESISVLKGGAAAALYGMRAGHGVILITTKSGAGKAKGVEITYDGNYNIDQVYSLQKMQNKYGQGYLGDEWFYKIAQKDGFTGTYQDFAIGGYTDSDDVTYGFKYVDGLGNGVNDGVDESWGPRLDIGLMIPQYNSKGKPAPWVSHPNNMKDLFQFGHTTNHNLALTSVTDNSNTRVSLGYMDQIGTLPNTDLRRYTAGLNSTMKLTKLIEYNLSLTYSRNESDNLPIGEYNASNPMQSMGQWMGRQVDLADLKKYWRTDFANGFPYNWNSNYHNNPFWSLNKNTNSFQKDRVFGKTSLFIKPFEGFKVEGRLGLDYFNTSNKPIITWRSNEVLADYSGVWDGGWFRLNSQTSTELNADLLAYYDKIIGDFSINLLGGGNYRNYRWSRQTLGANILTVPDLFTISNVSGSPVTEMDNVWIRTNSVYGSGSFGYKNYLFLDATIRNDWSSTIKDPFFYPSVSLSVLPLDIFEVNSDILSYLKIRGGWSKVGSATEAYAIDPYFSAGSATIYGVTQYNQTIEYPPVSLKPEQVVTNELGLEANFLQKRIGLDVALYDKTTTNQILSVAVSRATGYSTTRLNAGKLNNKGIEVQLRGSILKKSNGLNWDMTINWSKEKSEVVELYTDPVTGQAVASYPIGSQWSTYVQARPGEPWGVIYGTGMLRRKSDNAIIVNSGGRPRTQTNMIIGNVTPDWLGGIRNEFSYKNLSAGFLVDIRKGGDVFSVSSMFGAYSGMLEFTALDDHRENGLILGKDFMKDEKFVKIVGTPASDIQNSEFAENDIVTGAQDFFESYYTNRELSIYDGSFVKLREAHITYRLPKNLFGPESFVKGGTVALVGTNLAILWRHKSNLSGLDPENSVGNGNGGVGLETTSYPPSRSIGLKVNFSF